MLHLVEARRGAREEDVLRGMFAARKEVFIDLLEWDIPVLDGRYEMDQFDDEQAVYLVLADPAGGHMASARLLPTTRPHILADLYASLCDGAVPRGPGTYEVTRFCIDRRLDRAGRRSARNRLVMAIAEFGLANGISRYTGVAEPGWLEQVLAFGWRAYALGGVQQVSGMLLGALAIEIDEDTPRLLAETGIVTGPAQARETHHVF